MSRPFFAEVAPRGHNHVLVRAFPVYTHVAHRWRWQLSDPETRVHFGLGGGLVAWEQTVGVSRWNPDILAWDRFGDTESAVRFSVMWHAELFVTQRVRDGLDVRAGVTSMPVPWPLTAQPRIHRGRKRYRQSRVDNPRRRAPAAVGHHGGLPAARRQPPVGPRRTAGCRGKQRRTQCLRGEPVVGCQGSANTNTPLPPRGLRSSGMRSAGRIVAQLEPPIDGPARNATNCRPSTA